MEWNGKTPPCDPPGGGIENPVQDKSWGERPPMIPPALLRRSGYHRPPKACRRRGAKAQRGDGKPRCTISIGEGTGGGMEEWF
jgi:hypothetical protein